MKPGVLSSTSALSEAFGTIERRRESRVRVDISGRLKCLNPLISSGPSAGVRIIEISYHGMKLCVGQELFPGGLVQIIVSGMVLMGTVRHAQRKGAEFEIGIRLSERIPSCLGQA